MKYYIKEAIWQRIYTVLSQVKGLHVKDIAKLRIFLEAVWYMARSGCQWRLLPNYYGKWRTIHARFRVWAQKGVWEYLFENVQDEPDMQEVMIDGTIVRAHACAAGYGKDSQAVESLGRSAGGFSTKIHTLTDALGNPLKFILSPGQRNEIIKAEELIEGMEFTTLIADKGYDSDAFIKKVESKEIQVVIPPRANRKLQRDYDKHLYKERHLIECFFGKIKYFRRIFSRFDKSALSYLSFIHFAAALLWTG